MVGITEENAALLSAPGTPVAPGLAVARDQLAALRPGLLRLFVDWSQLQPDPARPADLAAHRDGCARGVGPCSPYRGLDAELRAIATRPWPLRPAVELVVYGVPAWAAASPHGCEAPGTATRSRPVSAEGLRAYRALVASIAALGERDGVAPAYWAPYNEPNQPFFVSPQRERCDPRSPSLAPALYAQLAGAMRAALVSAGVLDPRLVLGELAVTRRGPHATSVAEFVRALPGDLLCEGGAFALHAYAAAAAREAVPALETALDDRGACGRRLAVWVTETGAGALRPGAPRRGGAREERATCHELSGLLLRWYADPRVAAVLQYSFREDPAYPVGLASADLRHLYPAYRLWASLSEGASAPAPC